LAAMAYLLPLAGGLTNAHELFAAYPGLAIACAPLIVLAMPCMSPLGAVVCSAWMLCGVADRKTIQSYFLRYNFCQALMLGASLMLPSFLAEVLPATWCATLGTLWGALWGQLLLAKVVWPASALGLTVLACTWAFLNCAQGRFPDRIPLVSSMANRLVRW